MTMLMFLVNIDQLDSWTDQYNRMLAANKNNTVNVVIMNL